MAETVSTILGGQAAKRWFKHNGKRYTCRPMTLTLKSEIERRLEQTYRNALVGDQNPATRPHPEILTFLLRQHQQDVVDGRFAFGGPAHTGWLTTAAGVLATVGVFFGLDDDEAEQLVLERGDEVTQMIDLAIREALPKHALVALEKAEAALAESDKAEGEASTDPDPND